MTEALDATRNESTKPSLEAVTLLEEFEIFQRVYDRANTPEQKLHVLSVFINGRLGVLSDSLDKPDPVFDYQTKLRYLKEATPSLPLSSDIAKFLNAQIEVISLYLAQELDQVTVSKPDDLRNRVSERITYLLDDTIASPDELKANLASIRTDLRAILGQFLVTGKDFDAAQLQALNLLVLNEQAPKILYILQNAYRMLSFVADKLSQPGASLEDPAFRDHNCLPIFDQYANVVQEIITLFTITNNLIPRLQELLKAGPQNLNESFHQFFPLPAGLHTEPVEECISIEALNELIIADHQAQLKNKLPELGTTPVFYDLELMWSELTDLQEKLSQFAKKLNSRLPKAKEANLKNLLGIIKSTRKNSESTRLYSVLSFESTEGIRLSLLELVGQIELFLSKYSSLSEFNLHNPEPASTYVLKEDPRTFQTANLTAFATPNPPTHK
jgi:hypothetical protein